MLGSAFLALALAIVPSGVTAVTFSGNNQWDLACTGGKCAYYTGDGVKKAHTTFTISGPSGALSDITGAAGWQIKGCDSNWSTGAAHVSIVCSGTRVQMARCSQLFEDGGAVDTIVRLPTNCGTGPFARVVSSVEVTPPGNVLRAPETHNVVLDYNFNKIKKVRGEVSFAVTTSNVPSTGTVPADAAVLRRNGTELLKRWEAKEMFNLPPIAINEARNLYSQSINCPAPSGLGVGYSAGVSVDVSARVNALAAFGFTVSGTILPPAIDRFQILGSLNGSASADFTVQAHAQGSFDIGKLPLYEASIPGLNIPGILTVGPKFGVYGTLRADIGLEATIKAGVSYAFPDVSVAWPKDSGVSTAKTIQSKNPLFISVDPKATASGVVTAGVIPRLEIGINVLSGFASAMAYIDLTAEAELDLTVEGHASAVVPIELDGSGNVVTDPKTSSGASGCADLDASLAITAGAKGTLKPIFDEEVTYPIYSTSWEIFDKCFGAGDVATKHAAMKAKRAAVTTLERRDFICPPLGLSDLLELISL